MDNVVLWNNERRRVRLMDEQTYERIKEFILSRFREHNTVSLMSILEHTVLARGFSRLDVMPLIVLVKNDLVARGVLKITFNPDRSQTIILKKRKFNRY